METKVFCINSSYLLLSEDNVQGSKEAIWPVDQVIYSDLFFTLQNDPNKYFRPIVKFNGSKFVGIANNIFLKALLETGAKQIYCSVVIDSIDQLIMKKYRLYQKNDSTHHKEQYHNFVFFDLISTINENILRQVFFEMDCFVRSREHLDDHERTQFKLLEKNKCIEYWIPNTDFNDKEFGRLLSAIPSAYLKLSAHLGPLRSINGLKRDLKEFWKR